MKKAKIQAALLAATVVTGNAQAATPQYPSIQEPQGKTQTVDMPKEAMLTSKNLVEILGSIEIFKDITVNTPNLSDQIAKKFLHEVQQKGTPSIDKNTITINNKTLKDILLNDIGFNNEDITPAMVYFNKLATQQHIQQSDKEYAQKLGDPNNWETFATQPAIDNNFSSEPTPPHNEEATPSTKSSAKKIEKDGHIITYSFDKDGTLSYKTNYNEDVRYLQPARYIRDDGLYECGPLTSHDKSFLNEKAIFQLRQIKLEHLIYQDIGRPSTSTEEAFFKQHETDLKAWGLKTNAQGKLYQTDPMYTPQTNTKTPSQGR